MSANVTTNVKLLQMVRDTYLKTTGRSEWLSDTAHLCTERDINRIPCYGVLHYSQLTVPMKYNVVCGI